jgi:hypothetical protein
VLEDCFSMKNILPAPVFFLSVFFILTQSSLDADMEAKTAIPIQYAIFVKMEVSNMLETRERREEHCILYTRNETHLEQP